MASRPYLDLQRRLAEACAPLRCSKGLSRTAPDDVECVEAIVNSPASAKPFVAILIQAVHDLEPREQEMVVRALSERGMPGVAPVLIEMMRALANRSTAADSSLRWALGNALVAIQDPASYEAVVQLCSDPRLGEGRQMLFSLLPKIGTETAYAVAVDGLNDGSVRGHALDALGRFSRPEALALVRAVAVTPGKYEAKAKATAIRKLERLALRGPRA